MAIINGSSVNGMTMQAEYSITQNTSANTSTVTVSLKLANHYALYASALSGSYISVGGNKSNYSKSISYGGSATTTTTLATKTVTVSHNSDGTGICTIGGTFVMNGTYRGTHVSTLSVSSTITLPKIARSSSFTISSSVNTGSSLSGTVTPSSTSFNHKIQLKIGSTVKGTINLAVGTKTFSYTVPHSWLPSSTSGTITAVLQTYNGSTLVATTSKNVTVNVPSNIMPSISNFVVESVDGMNGLSIRGKSRVRLTAYAAPGDGAASMATYTFSGNNVTDNSSSTTIYNTANSSVITTGILNYTGAATYTVTVADMRGRKVSASLGIEVFEYAPPAITYMSVQRCNANGTLNENGTYAYVTVNSKYTTLYHNNTNYNSRTIVLTNSTNGLATTIQATSNTNSSWSGVYGNGTFATGSTHTITATIKDTAYGYSASMSQPLKAAARPLNIRANGKGIGLGKMAESDNLLDVQWNERVRGNLHVDGTGSIDGIDISKNTYILGGSRDNITDENWIAGTQSFIGTYSQGDKWYSTISLRHRNGQGDGSNYGMQLRSILTQQDNLSWRQHMNGSWGNWKTILDSSNTADYVVEQGAQGDWTYRKWNSGFAECWRNVSVTPGNVNGTNSITMTLPFTFANTNYNVTITPAKAAMYVDRWGDCATNGAITHTTTNFTMAYNYAYGTAYNVSFNIVINGKWK